YWNSLNKFCFRGILDESIGEGTHFLIPWVQKPYIFDIKTRPHTFSSISGTKDLQMVNLTLRVLSRHEAERSKFIVMKAEQERRAAVIRAEGESDAAILISEATAAAGMGLVELRRIEASREVAGTLAKSPNVTYLPGGNNMMMALNPAG
ncbi:hypothetical protein RYX36_000246, partial [Vicia faba]